MQLLANPVIRLPKVLLEHPLPIDGTGVSAVVKNYLDRDGMEKELIIGGVDRWERCAPVVCPGINLDRLTVLAALLSLTERNSGIIISYNQLFRAVTGSDSYCSAHHREALKKNLAELASIDIAIREPQRPTVYQPIIKLSPAVTRPVFGKTSPAFEVGFAPVLVDLLGDGRNTMPVHLQAMRSLRSRMARVLYLQFCTWAYYSRASIEKPFRITLSRLIDHIAPNANRAALRFRSQRRAYFAGHRSRSIFEELHGIQTPYGNLSIEVVSAMSVEDDMLKIYHRQEAGLKKGEDIESTPLPSSYTPVAEGKISSRRKIEVHNNNQEKKTEQMRDSLASFRGLKLYSAWVGSGRETVEFLSRVKTSGSLTPEDLEILHTAGVSASRCENFLTLAKKLLPERTWVDLIGEAKYAALSHQPPSNPTGKLISEILSAVRGAI